MHDVILRFAGPVTPDMATSIDEAVKTMIRPPLPELLEVLRREETDPSASSEIRQAWRVLDLARTLKELGDTPREVGSEHSAAQSSMASMGYELATFFMAAFEGHEKEATVAARLHDAKELAMEVLGSWPSEAAGRPGLNHAVQLLGQSELELEEAGLAS